MSKHPSANPTAPAFEPVPVRFRKDGWTPEKQARFIASLMISCSVTEAARSVGMSARSAHELRARQDAASFRAAWAAALAAGVPALTSAAMDRALNGTVVPIFYKGEQIGERRVFNEVLTMFLMRHHDQQRYGKWRDKMMVERADPDGATLIFHEALRRLAADLVADQIGQPRVRREPLGAECIGSDPEAEARAIEASAKLMKCAVRRSGTISSESSLPNAPHGRRTPACKAPISIRKTDLEVRSREELSTRRPREKRDFSRKSLGKETSASDVPAPR